MDDVQRIDWDISWLVVVLGAVRVGRRANGLHHGQMRNDVVFAVSARSDWTARESPIFRNNKIVPENGISGTVTFPLWRNGEWS